MTLILLLLGIGLLILGGQLVVQAGSSLAKRFGLSEFLIGLTIVTIGTSLPELFVSLTAGWEQRVTGIEVNNLVLGQIVGSAVGNIGLVLGLAGLLGGLAVDRKQLPLQSFFLVGSMLVFWLFISDGVFSGYEAIFSLLLYVGYVVLLALIMPRKVATKVVEAARPSWWLLGQLLIGLGLLLTGAELVVTHGQALAAATQMSQALVGILVVGLGTSLPELVVTVTAAAKRARELSVGNIIGSNIFDVLVALSGGALFTDWRVSTQFIDFDVPFMVFISTITMLFFVSRRKLEPRESLLLIGLYAVYLTWSSLHSSI